MCVRGGGSGVRTSTKPRPPSTVQVDPILITTTQHSSHGTWNWLRQSQTQRCEFRLICLFEAIFSRPWNDHPVRISPACVLLPPVAVSVLHCVGMIGRPSFAMPAKRGYLHCQRLQSTKKDLLQFSYTNEKSTLRLCEVEFKFAF